MMDVRRERQLQEFIGPKKGEAICATSQIPEPRLINLRTCDRSLLSLPAS